jgi:phosphoribosyl-ATP pyrophosphohydrolase
MAKTIEQIQTMITSKADAREVINEIADYLQANPGGGSGVSYLSYTALMSQSSDNAVTAKVLENNTGMIITGDKQAAGFYEPAISITGFVVCLPSGKDTNAGTNIRPNGKADLRSG